MSGKTNCATGTIVQHHSKYIPSEFYVPIKLWWIGDLIWKKKKEREIKLNIKLFCDIKLIDLITTESERYIYSPEKKLEAVEMKWLLKSVNKDCESEKNLRITQEDIVSIDKW